VTSTEKESSNLRTTKIAPAAENREMSRVYAVPVSILLTDMQGISTFSKKRMCRKCFEPEPSESVDKTDICP
jgi:hypothetical protein